MTEIYSAQALDHYAQPRNLGRLPDAHGRGVAGDLRSGDTRVEIAIRVEAGRIAAARHRTFGCSATIAAASMATMLVTDRTPDEAGALTADEVTAALGGLPANRLYAPALAADAVRQAVEDYRARNSGA